MNKSNQWKAFSILFLYIAIVIVNLTIAGNGFSQSLILSVVWLLFLSLIYFALIGIKKVFVRYGAGAGVLVSVIALFLVSIITLSGLGIEDGTNVQKAFTLIGLSLTAIAILGAMVKGLKYINDKFGTIASIGVVGVFFLGIVYVLF